jgi:Ribbon-helix-helix protein, copG family
MYDGGMKRLQIMIEEDTYQALDALSASAHVSKASLIRRYVRLGLQPLSSLAEDPLTSLSGSADFEPADIDETVYDR